MVDESSKDTKELFEQNHAALKEWPYALNAIEETLDLDLLQGRAHELLFRALNTQSLVAFVGTGVSAAYGRMSWQQLVEKQLGDVEDVSNAFISVANASKNYLNKVIDHLDSPPDPILVQEDGAVPNRTLMNHLRIKKDEIVYRLAEIEHLHKNFQSLKKSKGVLGSETYPIQFQIAKRLQDALQESEALYINRPKIKGKFRGGPLGYDWRSDFERCELGYLADGEPDGQYMLWDEFDKSFNEADSGPLKDKFKEAFEIYHDVLRRRGSNLKFKDYSKHLVYDELSIPA